MARIDTDKNTKTKNTKTDEDSLMKMMLEMQKQNQDFKNQLLEQNKIIESLNWEKTPVKDKVYQWPRTLKYHTIIVGKGKSQKEAIVTNYTAYRDDPAYGDRIRNGNEKEKCNKILTISLHNGKTVEMPRDVYMNTRKKSDWVEFGITDFRDWKIDRAYTEHMVKNIVSYHIEIINEEWELEEITLHPNAIA